MLDKAGHGDDLDGPLFRPVRKNQHAQEERRHLNDKEIYRIVRKYVRKAGINDRGFSAHSTRATFITEALRNGASIEDVQAHVGHADISTTKLYDRRRLNPEQSPAFYVKYEERFTEKPGIYPEAKANLGRVGWRMRRKDV